MAPLSMTFSDPWPAFQGRDIFWSQIARKRNEIEPYLVQNVSRKSYALYRMVTFSMTLTGPNPVFKVTAYLKSNIAKTILSYYRTLIGKRNQSIEWYHIQWPGLTFDLDFKVEIFLDIECHRNDTRQSHSYYRTSIESHALYRMVTFSMTFTDP